MSWDAGAITAKLGMDTSGFLSGMLQAQTISSMMPGWVTAFMANPLLGIINLAQQAAGAIGAAVREMGQRWDDAGEAAEKAGVSVEFLSSVGVVAGNAGTSAEAFAQALKFLNNNAADAASGVKSAQAAFGAIGIEVTDSSGKLKSTETLFFEVADAIAGLDEPAKKTQAAMNLLGRGGTDMIVMMNQGGGSIKAFAQEVANLGGSVSSEQARIGDIWGELVTKFNSAIIGIKSAVAQPILAALAEDADAIKEKIAAVSNWLREAIGGAMGVIVPIVQGAWSLFGALAGVVGTVVGPAFAVLGAILKPIAEVLKFIMELIASVINGISGAVGGLMRMIGLGGSTPTPARITGEGSGGGGTTVKIEKIEMPALDTAEASTQIAGKIQPRLREAIRDQMTGLEAAGQSARVRRGL